MTLYTIGTQQWEGSGYTQLTGPNRVTTAGGGSLVYVGPSPIGVEATGNVYQGLIRAGFFFDLGTDNSAAEATLTLTIPGLCTGTITRAYESRGSGTEREWRHLGASWSATIAGQAFSGSDPELFEWGPGTIVTESFISLHLEYVWSDPGPGGTASLRVFGRDPETAAVPANVYLTPESSPVCTLDLATITPTESDFASALLLGYDPPTLPLSVRGITLETCGRGPCG